jgi:tetratricopeptide (TPR) repeat protein
MEAMVPEAPIVARPEPEQKGPPPYAGRMAEVMKLLESGKTEAGVVEAVRWQSEDPGDVMALVALGEGLEAAGNRPLAARAYGSILDLFPARADMRRFAAERLERLGADGGRLASDAYAKAVEERPDHLNAHRLLAFSLVREGKLDAAFAALEAGLSRSYPGGRFLGGDRILREDLGLVAAAWLKRDPTRRGDVERRLTALGGAVATEPSLRFVLYWETDANDVDFHIHDARGGHAFYQSRQLPSGGSLYEDVTTGYGPECFTIVGAPQAYPYRLQIHYYSRGPMGYGMGKLEVVEHDGRGGLKFEQRPFVVMNDGAFVDLGEVKGPL